MKNKYVTLEDIDNEIEESYKLIDDFHFDIKLYKRNIEKEEKRITYLDALSNYLKNDGLCPFTKRQILDNDLTLQTYVMPLIIKQDILKIKNACEREHKTYIVDASNIGIILSDFIDFVCEQKGHKIGVGVFYIQKFLEENKFI